MRGKAVFPARQHRTAGITPAYAGKRQADRSSLDIVRDHPRVCGEKSMCTRSPVSTSGSPPRMRGKVLKQLIVDSVDGITPAYAGKSRRKTTDRFCSRDHPRMCGEKYQPRGMQVSTTGSPPRMRGKAEKAGPRYRAPGITPAHAGKRPGWADSGCQRGDHPCVCGEKIFEHPVSLANQGSLPRVRGKALADYAVIPNIGITPACAGKRLPYR